MAELRDLIAETLAAHIRGHEGPPGVGRWFCTCGGWFKPLAEGSSIADFQRHLADVFLAALDGHLIPPGSETTVVRSIQGEDSDGPWIEYVYEGDNWPARGERFTRLEIGTPWAPVEAGQTPGGTGDE